MKILEKIRRAGLIAIVSLFELSTLNYAFAATIQVNSGLDFENDSLCTLRDAIESFSTLSASAGCVLIGTQAFGIDDTITFSGSIPAQKVTLNGSELTVANLQNPLTIDGTLNGGVTIDANRKSRVFNITNSNLTLRYLSINNGLEHPSGAGLNILNSKVGIINSSVTNNIAIATTFTPSTGSSSGGIAARDSEILISNSLIDGNYATGLIAVAGAGSFSRGSLTISNSTISNNRTEGGGGGIGAFAITSEKVTIVNSTFSNNRSGLLVYGHALGINSPDLSISHSSFVNTNLRPDNANPIVEDHNSMLSIGPQAQGSISNSLFFANDGITCFLREGSKIEFTGKNLSNDGECGEQEMNMAIEELADNGCLLSHASEQGASCIKTHALQENSPAIDAAIGSELDRDQRGISRIEDKQDVGAYEVGEPLTTAPQLQVIPLKKGGAIIVEL